MFAIIFFTTTLEALGGSLEEDEYGVKFATDCEGRHIFSIIIINSIKKITNIILLKKFNGIF